MFSFNEEELNKKELELNNEYSLTKNELEDINNLIKEHKDNLMVIAKKRNDIYKDKDSCIDDVMNTLFIIFALFSVCIVTYSLVMLYIIVILSLFKLPVFIKLIRYLLSNELSVLDKDVQFLEEKVYMLEKKRDIIENKMRCIGYNLENVNDCRKVLEDIFRFKDKPLVRTRKVM